MTRTADETMLADFQKRLGADEGLRAGFLADPAAMLREAGFALDFASLGQPILIGEDMPTIAFTGSGTGDSFPVPQPWPRRYYMLQNQSTQWLAMESWQHWAGPGIKELGFAAEPGTTNYMWVATVAELLFDACNLAKASFLVRYVTSDNVAAESFNSTCGPHTNRYIVTDSDVDPALVVCRESHDIIP